VTWLEILRRRKLQANVSNYRELVEPKSHRLPELLMWLTVICTAVGMAFINFVSLLVIEFSLKWKFSVMQAAIDAWGLAAGVLVLVGLSVLCAVALASLILGWAKNCGGSGLPECKCYMNGSPALPSFFSIRNLFARIMASILANAAGFPVGREGPTVTIGSNLAYLVTYQLAMPFVSRSIEVKKNVNALIIEEERFSHATRINCAVGGACAMAMLFNTPIGGLLYMFEEISPASWPIELTFRAFVATTVCTLSSYFLLGLVGKGIREFVIFAWLKQTRSWTASEIPIFILLSAFLGMVTSYHTRLMLGVAARRKKWQDKWGWKNLGVATETALFCAFCAIFSGLVSLLADCRDEGFSGLQYVRFNCPVGQYNPVASLLVNTSHTSVKLLFSGENTGELAWVSTSLAFVAYFILNVGLAGLPVPGGAFTATMLLGGLFGRCVGSLLHEFGFNTSVSGVYAVVGASAMLCGFKQMAAAVVLIVVQCINDFDITPVVMLSVTVALAVNRYMNERGHDEEQIERKKLPYLEPEVPESLDNCIAKDLMENLPAEVKLPPHAHVSLVRKAIEVAEQDGRTDFPVLDGNSCVGIVTKHHLEAALKAHEAAMASLFESKQEQIGGSSSRSLLESPFGYASPTFWGRSNSYSNLPATKARRSEAFILRRVDSIGKTPRGDGEDNILPLDSIMDPTPFTIQEDMPAPRFYSLFSQVGETAAIVVNQSGEFQGLISRSGLIVASRELREHAAHS